jgi:hypothetical protein
VSIDVSAIDPVTDLAIPVSEIESALNEEFGGIRRQARAPRLLDLSRYGMDPTSGQLLEAAGLSPRPTERAAVLMRALLIYSVVGLSALRRFDDVAPIVIGAVGSLRRAVSEQTRPHEAERAVADAIRLIFEELPPAERGEIIFHGAAYLSDFAEVRAALSDLMSLTSDAALAPYKEDVEQFLRDQGRRRRT